MPFDASGAFSRKRWVRRDQTMRHGQKTALRVLLASRSPARLQLLQRAGFHVRVVEPDVEEVEIDSSTSVESYVHQNAWLKAQAVARSVGTGLIVAADTVASLDGKILGKPRDRSDAERMLRLLSGTRHKVLTGLCVCRAADGLCVSTVETTEVAMRPWGPREIAAYLDGGAWQGKSGAYAILEQDDPFVEHVAGSVANVRGLPVERLLKLLEQFPALVDQEGAVSCETTVE